MGFASQQSWEDENSIRQKRQRLAESFWGRDRRGGGNDRGRVMNDRGSSGGGGGGGRAYSSSGRAYEYRGDEACVSHHRDSSRVLSHLTQDSSEEENGVGYRDENANANVYEANEEIGSGFSEEVEEGVGNDDGVPKYVVRK